MGKRFKNLMKANQRVAENANGSAKESPNTPQASSPKSSPHTPQEAANLHRSHYSSPRPPPFHLTSPRPSSSHHNAPPTSGLPHFSHRPPVDYGPDRHRTQNNESGYGPDRPRVEMQPLLDRLPSPPPRPSLHHRNNYDRRPAQPYNSSNSRQIELINIQKQEDAEVRARRVISDSSESDMEVDVKPLEKKKHKRNRNRFAMTGSSDSSSSESEDEKAENRKNIFYMSTANRQAHRNCFIDEAPASKQDVANAEFDDSLKVYGKLVNHTRNLRNQFRKMRIRYDDCALRTKMGTEVKKAGPVHFALNIKDGELAKWKDIRRKSPSEWVHYIVCRMHIRDIESIRDWPKSEARKKRCIEERLADMNQAKNGTEGPEKEKFMIEVLNTYLNTRDPKSEVLLQIFTDMVEEALQIPTAAVVYCAAFAGLIGQFGHNNDEAGSSGFNADLVADWYTKVIKKVGATVNASALRSSTDPRRLKDWVENFIFFRAKLDMETGHVGRVVAILQAFIEFHCRPPDNVTEIRRKEYFKAFLQCGYPLIGEEEAVGWKKYDFGDQDANREKEHKDLLEKQADCSDEEKLVTETEREMGAKWKAIEEIRSRYAWMPSRFDHGNTVRNLYVDPIYISDTLTAFPIKQPAFRMICRLFQTAGVYFGPNPVIVDGHVLENDNFSWLIRTVLPQEFDKHFAENTELCKFLVHLMISCLRLVPPKIGYPLMVGIGETVGSIVTDQLEEVRDIVVRRLDRCNSHRRDLYDFARIKLLEVECNINEFYCSFGPISDEGSDAFAKSEQFQSFLDELPSVPLEDIENVEDRCFYLWIIVQVAKRLASIRGKFGSRRQKPPTLNRSRFIALALFAAAPRTAQEFLNKKVIINEYHYRKTLETLDGMFQNESSSRVPDIFNVTGSFKDLVFTLYAMMVYETSGDYVYENLEKPPPMGKDKADVKMYTYLKMGDNHFGNMTRLEFSCALMKEGVVDDMECRIMALRFLRRYPFVPIVWKCLAPFLSTMKPFGNPFPTTNEPRVRTIHSLLEFCAKWADAKCNLNGVDIVYIRKAFKNIREGAQRLPYADSTIARLRVLVEDKANTGESAFIEALTYFPFAKLCAFDDLAHVKDVNPQSQAHLREISELMTTLGHRVLTPLSEVPNNNENNQYVEEAMDIC